MNDWVQTQPSGRVLKDGMETDLAITHGRSSPSKFVYISVWVFVGLIIRLSGFAYGYYSTQIFPEILIPPNKFWSSFYTFHAGGFLLDYIVTVLIYSQFKSLNLIRVIPYMWGLGMLGLVYSYIIILGSYISSGVIPQADAGKFTVFIFVGGVASILAISWHFKILEGKKSARSLSVKVSESLTMPQGLQSSAGAKPFDANVSRYEGHKSIAGGISGDSTASVSEEPQYLDVWASFSKANILIRYDDRAAFAWNELDAVSEALKLKFMRALEADTKQNVNNLKEAILEEHHSVSHPFDTDELNVAHAKAKKLSKACAEEFMRAYNVLGDTISAENLLEKVSKKYEKRQIASDDVEDLANAIKSKNQKEILECLKKLNYQVELSIGSFCITNSTGNTKVVPSNKLVGFALDQLVILRYIIGADSK